VAMQSMDRSTLDAISDCIKEGGHSDVVPCRLLRSYETSFS
jgi:hypothetical protein